MVADDRSEATDSSKGSEASNRRSDPAQVFAALSDSLRVDILREMNAYFQATGEMEVGFAELRKRIGIQDSGRFRYHLNKLCGHFVKKTSDGYRLTHAGIQILAAIFAGTYTDTVSLGPVELDSECPFCGQPAVASCQDGVCFVTCANEHPLFQWSVPPNATAEKPLSEIIDLAELLAFQAIEQALAGVCSQCYNPVDPEVVVEEQTRPGFRSTCSMCSAQVIGPASFCLLVDDEVMAFCRRHGFTLQDDHVWEFPFVSDDSAVTAVEKDPVQVTFEISFNGETLAVIVDEQGQVDLIGSATE